MHRVSVLAPPTDCKPAPRRHARRLVRMCERGQFSSNVCLVVTIPLLFTALEISCKHSYNHAPWLLLDTSNNTFSDTLYTLPSSM